MTCETCRTLLSAGLDLCVRARKMDAQERTNSTLDASSDGDAWQKSGRFATYVERANIVNPHAPLMPRSSTIALWLQDQYDRDLYEWEQKSRHHLQQGCANG